MAAGVKHTPSYNQHVWQRNHAEFVHERDADHYITARNSTQRSSHHRPHTQQRQSIIDRDAFKCDVFDSNDDEDTNIDRADPTISWRHFLQARSKMKPGRAVGTDDLNAEVVRCLSMRGTLVVVYPQRHGLGGHVSNDVDPLSCSMSSEGPCNAEGSATQGGSLAPGVLGCDVGQGSRRMLATHSNGQNSQSHPILAAVVLRLLPRTSMCGHDLDCDAAHGEKQNVAQQTTGRDQAGYKEGV